MTFLAAQPIEQRQAEQVQALTPSDPDGLKPGFFSGSGTAIGTGFGRVGAVASELVNDAGYLAGSTFVTKPIDALFDTDLTGFIDQKMRQEPAQLTASMTPDPYTTGSLGQILYGFVGIGVPAAVGTYFGGPAGGAAMAGGFQATGTYTDLTQQGVDPNTAGAAALFDGSLAGVGVGLPASIGSRVLLNTMLYGPGINVAQDLIAGQGMSAILENGGYSEMAERYAEIDGEMLAADAILGAAFGWHGARVGRAGRAARSAPTASEIDAGLAAMNRRHAEVDTAPGTPADLLAVQSHVRNLESATAAILDGRRVEVEPARGEFLARPEQVIPAPDEFVRAIRESGLPGLMDDIDALEAEMTRRGRVLPDEELPDVRRVGAAADAAPAVSELAPVASRETAADGPAKIEPVPGGAEFIATTKGGEFRLVDAPAPAGADFSEFGEVRQVLAYDGDKPVGKLVYANDGTPPTIEVDSAYQRRGIATAMNKLARQQGGVLGDAKTGIRGRGAEYRTPAGQAFRQGADESAVTLKRAGGPQEARAPGAGASVAGGAAVERVAASVVADVPDMDLPGGIRAADALEQADAAIARAENDSTGFEAAIACFMRNGA